MGTVLIIGGGAAGLAAAIAAAACGDQVTILERMDRVGKKILATGNGRCNDSRRMAVTGIILHDQNGTGSSLFASHHRG